MGSKADVATDDEYAGPHLLVQRLGELRDAHGAVLAVTDVVLDLVEDDHPQVGSVLGPQALDAQLDRGLEPLEEPAVAEGLEAPTDLLVPGPPGLGAEVVPGGEPDHETDAQLHGPIAYRDRAPSCRIRPDRRGPGSGLVPSPPRTASGAFRGSSIGGAARC